MSFFKKAICIYFLKIIDLYSHLRFGKILESNLDGIKLIDNFLENENILNLLKSEINIEVSDRKKAYKKTEAENIFIFRYEKYLEINNWVNNFIETNDSFFSKLANEVTGNVCKISKIDILVNFGIESAPEKKLSGSALYHRDQDSIVRYAKIFIPLIFDNCQDSETSLISKKDIPDHIYLVPKESRSNLSDWNKSRIEDDQIISFTKKPIEKVVKKISMDKIAAFDCTRIYHAGGYISNSKGLRVILQLSYATKSPANFKNDFSKLDLFLLSSYLRALRFFQIKVYS
jgi:hypothetical protein